MLESLEDKFTRYEIARILGARSLQLAMDAPILLKMSEQELDDLNFDTLKIAERELEAGVLPITVRRPLPKKSEKQVKKLTEDEIKEKLEKQAEEEKKEIALEKQKQDIEVKEEKEIEEEGEIMAMANPEDEEDSGDEGEKREEI